MSVLFNHAKFLLFVLILYIFVQNKQRSLYLLLLDNCLFLPIWLHQRHKISPRVPKPMRLGKVSQTEELHFILPRARLFLLFFNFLRPLCRVPQFWCIPGHRILFGLFQQRPRLSRHELDAARVDRPTIHSVDAVEGGVVGAHAGALEQL